MTTAVQVVSYVLLALVLVGALNWGLHALKYNLIEMIPNDTVQNVLYGVVALSAVGVVALLILNKIKVVDDSE